MKKVEFNQVSVHMDKWYGNTAIKVLFSIGTVSLLATAYFLWKDPHHYFFSYLFSFLFFLTISVGAMFFVLIQSLTGATWSTVVRRVPEHLMQNIMLMALFFIPIFFGLHDLYHWTHQDAIAADPLLQWKVPYLNIPFFSIRAVLFFCIWFLISRLYFKKSISQDTSKDVRITETLRKLAPVSLIGFALTVTFAFVDWVMSLTPHWYSTMFGVYMFAGSVVGFFAVTSLVYIVLIRKGFFANVITKEHFHDLGKLMYGFNIFWAYVAFSQYFLIWYSNIPEETLWFQEHFSGSWESFGWILSVGHFAIPFFIFMSRHVKRNLSFHAGVSAWLLFMHLLDLYWLVLPNIAKKGIHVSVVDITSFVGIGAIYFAVFIMNLRKYPLIPLGDPNLDRSLAFKNF